MGEYKIIVQVLGLCGVYFTTRLIAMSLEEAKRLAIKECASLYSKGHQRKLGFKIFNTELIREL